MLGDTRSTVFKKTRYLRVNNDEVETMIFKIRNATSETAGGHGGGRWKATRIVGKQKEMGRNHLMSPNFKRSVHDQFHPNATVT